jgi:hypothetical protein
MKLLGEYLAVSLADVKGYALTHASVFWRMADLHQET